MRRRLVLLASILVAATFPGGSNGRGGPVTLVTTRSPILAFAQDGGRIAWIAQTGHCDFGPIASVYERAVAGGPVALLQNSEICSERPPALALAGATALWTEWQSGNATYTQLTTGAPGRKSRAAAPQLVIEWDGGSFPGAIAGDGELLVYSILWRTADETTCSTDVYGDRQCRYQVDGATYRVVGTKRAVVRGADGAVALGMSAPYIGIGPVAVSTYDDPRSESDIVGPTSTTTHVVDARSGRVVTSFDPTGTPREVALAPAFVATLVQQEHTKRIEVRDARTARLLRNVPVPRTAHAISAAAHSVVYAVGRDVYALDTRTFAIRRLAHAGSEPIGLSVEGQRVAWAENVRGAGAVRALTAAGL